MKQQIATPLPLKQLVLLSLASLPDALSVTIVIPFAPFMVQEMLNIPPSSSYKTGYYCGLIASCFACGSIFGSPVWGRICDKIGRRPVILCGLFTNSFFLFLFGLSHTYAQAISIRFLHGMLTGNVTVSKTYLSDITDSTNESAAFGMIGMTFGFGVVMGPLVGGYLSRPAIQYSSIFGRDSFFARYPYALPCMTVGTFAACSYLLSLFLLPESKPFKEASDRNADSNLLPLSNEENEQRATVSVPIHIYDTFSNSPEIHFGDETYSSLGETASRTSEVLHEASYHQQSHEHDDGIVLEYQKNTDFDSSVYLSNSYDLREGFFIREPAHDVMRENSQGTFASQRLKRGSALEIRSAFSRERPLENYYPFIEEQNEQTTLVPPFRSPCRPSAANLNRADYSAAPSRTNYRKKNPRHYLFLNSPSTSAVSDMSGFAAIMAMSTMKDKVSRRSDWRRNKDRPSANNNGRNWSDIREESPKVKETVWDTRLDEKISELTLRALITHLFFSNATFSVVLRIALSVSFTLNAMDEVLALWAVNDSSLGGVQFSTADLGVVQTMGGISCIFSAVVFFQYIAAKIGVLNTMRLGLLIGLVFYPTPAYVATLGLTRSNRLTWILLVVGNVMTSFCGQCCHTALPLLVKNAAPPERLGEALGYAQGLQSVGFAAGPLVGSCLFAFILGENNLPQPLNKGRLYYILGDAAVFFILRSTFLLPPWPWRTCLETDMEVESD
ncbi:Probable peptide/nitrate transporter [Galdieria sulphuraria]|uniref:MFS transporter, DHA1 family, tetracycline:hydrogen antiporter n=1 Tax=Galdieria sulphuraria TaxID=130081 RepID=M2XV96_GALSU|nr:MFS transporter, DHA1 family, tetracycline:hydrogen antiporter [Galdieria sulphuraria]EME27583.1 MFS transporter, DHA1 family, tetracycline:hydrogen antiporter [Galdieria sulphuraria]GJD09778.1 Probable peptide/nitrate transporter [Galdieria sulphuraria]|eukprot:XP_005704103.1 MFS transporter, DHA1 family, tetracycline:hydrogen antiporter [Galdieria sulphuraria]